MEKCASILELIEAHLDAVWSSDYDSLDRPITSTAELSVLHGDISHRMEKAAYLYRFVSQAWYFFPEKTDLTIESKSEVVSIILMTNGGGLHKKVEGHYHVSGGMIDRIQLIDAPASL